MCVCSSLILSTKGLLGKGDLLFARAGLLPPNLLANLQSIISFMLQYEQLKNASNTTQNTRLTRTRQLIIEPIAPTHP